MALDLVPIRTIVLALAVFIPIEQGGKAPL